MKRIYIIALSLSLLLSCDNGFSIIDRLLSLDKSLAKVLEYRLENNTSFTIRYNDTVRVIDLEYDGDKISYERIGSIFTITLPNAIRRGENKILSISVQKHTGTITRSSFLLIGKNNDIPRLLINEVSIKGNASNPDRIELLVLEDGNTAGVVIQSYYKATSGHQFILPELDVTQGDIIVIYWDSITVKETVERDLGKHTYYLNARSPSTLLSTNGIIVLMDELNGNVMDALVYSNRNSEDYSGFGNEKLEKDVRNLISIEAWVGSAVDSSNVTSSRVLARLPDGVDTDSSSDWFTTKARMSTFGEPNTYDPYED